MVLTEQAIRQTLGLMGMDENIEVGSLSVIETIHEARAIESAVIAKIKAQGPDCYVDYAHTMMRTGKGIDAPVGAKFYRLPDEGEHDDND